MSRRAPKPVSDEPPAGPRPWQTVRKAKVARGKKLVKSKHYPTKKILASVAKLLARHLGEE